MNLLRTGEIALQDQFQRQVEAGLGGGVGGQKVLLWNKEHAFVRFDDHAKLVRPMVVMGDLEIASDKSYGQTRTNIAVNIKGLVSSLHEVNKPTFDAWLKKNPEVSLSTWDLAQLCASHLADLFENTRFDDKTGLWRLLLAFGERFAWERLAPCFNLKSDPRFLPSSLIPGASSSADSLHYTACWPSKHNTNAFLDLVPEWLNEKVGTLSVNCQALAHKLVKSGPQNNHFWIRECPLGDGVQEYPDFLLFVNGLPIVFVEMKTPEAGIGQAIKDFQTKPTYQGAPLCLASNGQEVIVTQAVSGKMEGWVSYATNLSSKTYWNAHSKPLHAQQYFVEQILSCPKRLEFFLTRACAADESGQFRVARAQQYQALAHFERDLQWTEVANTVLSENALPPLDFGNRLVRQTQRTGKTHTMIRSIHLALDDHPELFRLSLLMVGEVQILGQIFNEIKKNVALGDGYLLFERAESRAQLQQTVQKEAKHHTRTEGKVVLANMQKISADKVGSLTIPDSHKTLVVLDEGHLAQTGMTSDIRNMVFPNATHLLLTATPKNTMVQHYAITKPWQVLDDFGFGLARAARMVCPVVFKRYAYAYKDNSETIGKLVQSLKAALKIAKPSQFEDAPGLEQDIEAILSNEDNLQQSKEARDLAKAIRRQLEQEFMQERLDAVVGELETYKSGLETNADGNRIFQPRALVFDRDTKNAIAIIKFIQTINRSAGKTSDKELNVYKGWRFGVDVSNFGKDPTAQDNQTFRAHNPGVADQKDIEARLESQDPDLRIDVLLAVGKYTKGYDNSQLAVVALLRNVGETSLMNQIYTRPATQRDGKAKGVCLDLAFGLGNVSCWKESLRLYDQQVDLDNLLEQANIDELVNDVKSGLEKASLALGVDMETLAKPKEVIRTLEQLSETTKKEKARQFVLHARDVTASISNMPDSSIFGELRAPLIGLRCTLRSLQTLYPDLVEDTSLAADGSLDAGHTPQKLGEMIRQALGVLGQSSLKALLDIQLSESLVFDMDNQDSPEAVQAVYQVKLKNAHQKTITALEAVLGEDVHGRAPQASTVLLEAVNRVLDRLRDDAPSLTQRAAAVAEANRALLQWVGHEQERGDGLERFLREAMDLLLLTKTQSLNASLSDVGLDVKGVLHGVITVASEEMAYNFYQWFSGLPAEWVDKESSLQAAAWRRQYHTGSLGDFIQPTAQRTDVHGLDPKKWIEGFTSLQVEATRALLNDNLTGDGNGSLLTKVMELALERRQTILEAIKRNENLFQETEDSGADK